MNFWCLHDLRHPDVPAANVQEEVVCLTEESGTGVTRRGFKACISIGVHRDADANLWKHHV